MGITRRQIATVFGGKHQTTQPKGLRHKWYWFIVLFNLECLLFSHLCIFSQDYPVCYLCGAGLAEARRVRHIHTEDGLL